MTREEAIKLLKQYQGYDPMFPDGETLKHAFDLTDETVDTLLSALRPVSREQVERIWFREPYTRMEKRITPEGNRQYIAENICMACGSKTPIGHFCHNCGVALDTWAVDMMLKRMEEIYK